MHIVVMNNDNFVATHPGTAMRYTTKCETTTKIVRKLNTLIYVHYVIFLNIYVIDFLFVSRTFRRISEQIFL